MKLIVGLGNPGDEYARTRHNIGRRLVEFIAARENVKFVSKRAQRSAVASCSWNGETVHLAYPATYMNLSGEPVSLLAKYFKIEIARDLLIVVDDAALPFGKLRLRGDGSSGGHNGLASIEERLHTRAYPRLRMGIGVLDGGKNSNNADTGEPLRDYVLSGFEPSEEKVMEAFLGSGMEACRLWALESMTKAMNEVNAARS
jgi:PTH1 family peptidyl-tRNA hydrolase